MDTECKVELTRIRRLSEEELFINKDQSELNTSTNTTMDILKPGSKIQPVVNEDDAMHLAERFYGISTKDIKELNSYDDKNFHIRVDTNIKNPLIPNAWPHGYVLKIINSMDTRKETFFDAQTQMLLFLRQQGIECSKPVMNIYGKYHTALKIGTENHLVRLFEFLPGKIFDSVPKTANLFYQAGEFVALIDNALKRFTHEAFKSHQSIWMLDSFLEMSKFVYAVEDVTKQVQVQEVLNAFENEIVPNLSKYVKGIIHGDFNEQNIVVSKSDLSDAYKVTGVIDFGDTSLSYYVFELAIVMTYMMLQTGELETGGYVIAGYQEARHIPENEKKILKICVAARLCQSLVLGAYSHTLDPENEYILTTQKAGWPLLNKVWNTSSDELGELWFSTADNYLKQSDK